MLRKLLLIVILLSLFFAVGCVKNSNVEGFEEALNKDYSISNVDDMTVAVGEDVVSLEIPMDGFPYLNGDYFKTWQYWRLEYHRKTVNFYSLSRDDSVFLLKPPSYLGFMIFLEGVKRSFNEETRELMLTYERVYIAYFKDDAPITGYAKNSRLVGYEDTFYDQAGFKREREDLIGDYTSIKEIAHKTLEGFHLIPPDR